MAVEASSGALHQVVPVVGLSVLPSFAIYWGHRSTKCKNPKFLELVCYASKLKIPSFGRIWIRSQWATSGCIKLVLIKGAHPQKSETHLEGPSSLSKRSKWAKLTWLGISCAFVWSCLRYPSVPVRVGRRTWGADVQFIAWTVCTTF